MPMDEVWTIMQDQLYFLSYAFNFKIISFVMMSNHFHLIARTPDSNISEGMAFFLRESSRAIRRPSGRINQLWAERFSATIIKSNFYFNSVYKYVYRNPVEAKLCARVEDYPYSTLQQLLGNQKHIIPVEYDHFLYNPSVKSCLKWLNRKPIEQTKGAIRIALKRPIFKPYWKDAEQLDDGPFAY